MPLARSALNSWGLSPRVRGNRLALLALAVRVGFIPARAGEPRCPARHRRRCRGSIPARAGEPGTVVPANTVWRVYPRACGGTSMRVACAACAVAFWVYPRACGGTLERVNKKHLLNGSIPARAGEPTAILAVHITEQGLSPRVRGNPRTTSTAPLTSMVYPRACGGTSPVFTRLVGYWGLSPRVRGNHIVGGRRSPSGLERGSIPARAGEPSAFARAGEPFRGVYPRACGGTFIERSIPARAAWGLSPRVRGNGNDFGSPVLGSIPARAGEPSPMTGPCGAHVLRVYPRACGGTSTFTNEPNAPTRRVYPRACGGTLFKDWEPFQRLPWVYPRACGGTRIGPDESGSARGH